MTTNNTKTSSPKGTCQVCFNRQVAKATRGAKEPRLVLHGYQRPGWGFIQGECPGTRELPFELSCEVTKRIRGQVEESLVATRKRLAAAEAGEVKGLTIRIETAPPAGVPRWRHKETIELTVLPGWVNPSRPSDNWYGRLARRVDELASLVRHQESFLAELTKRIDGWRLAPEKIKGKPVAPREIDQLSAWYHGEETQAQIDELGLRGTVNKLVMIGRGMTTSRGNYTKRFYQAMKVRIRKAQEARA